MTALVLEASIALNAVIDDEASPIADAAMDAVGADGALSPWMWWAEVRNALIMMERRGRIGAASATAALGVLGSFSITLDHQPQSEAAMGLARTHGLSVYDALYLELALRRQSPLATLDKRLAAAATAEGRLWTPP